MASELEQIKQASRQLRGTIAEQLQSASTHFEGGDCQLLKFHGTYQEDDRDRRQELRKEHQERAYIFMVRSKIPGGILTADQYLLHDRVAGQYGNGTLRITSRQGLQLHFVLKGVLRDCIATINQSGITTWGACGDVVRNVMASPWPLDLPVYDDIRKLSVEIKDIFTAHSRAYSEIWLDGEKLNVGELVEEPVYGGVYLPRKFKFGIAVPPRNEIDIYTQDVGLVPHMEKENVAGYSFIIGGGMGMSHGKKTTYPALGQPAFYVERAFVAEVCKAIVGVQRDHGDREDRKHARMKYLIKEKGLDWFKEQVAQRLDPAIELADPKSLVWSTVSDMLGWHEQGNGKRFCCVWVPEGRIQDTDAIGYRTAFREIEERFLLPVRLTPNCNILFHDIDPANQAEIDAILTKHNVPVGDSMTEARRLGMACVALPTCGLALAESERVFQELLDQIDEHLRELHLENEPLLIRMTGCPNGCARPYNADIAFVGKSPGKYAVFVGGSHRGDRLTRLDKKIVDFADLPILVRGYLDEFVANRHVGEFFSDYWFRTHDTGEEPQPEQFHIEIGELDSVTE